MSHHQFNRRAFLRGLGVTMALPWMESVNVWGDTPRTTAAGPASEAPVRLAVLFSGNGFHSREWWAKGEGEAMELGAVLQPLHEFRKQMLFVRGLYNEEAQKGNIHSSQTGNLLSGAPLASVVAATPGAPEPAPAPAPVTAVSPQAAATLLAAVGFPESVLEIVAPALAPTPVVASPPPPQAVQAVTQAAVQSLTQQVQSLENEQNQDAQVAAQALANAATAQTEVVTNKNSHKHIHPAQTQTSSTTTTTDVNAPAPTWAWTPSDARVNAAAAVKKNWYVHSASGRGV